MLFFFFIMKYITIFESLSISRFKNPLCFVANTSSLKVMHSAIIIDVLLSTCLLVIIFIISLKTLITHHNTLLFFILELLKFNLNIPLIRRTQWIYFSITPRHYVIHFEDKESITYSWRFWKFKITFPIITKRVRLNLPNHYLIFMNSYIRQDNSNFFIVENFVINFIVLNIILIQDKKSSSYKRGIEQLNLIQS